jgi:polysaccharide biosynthesis/export protein
MQGRVLLVLLAAIANAGCSYMPTNGPADYDVRSGPGRPDSLPYGFVKITPPVLAILADNEPRLGTTFADRRVPSEIRFGVGDVVSVTIFEAAAGGLFIPSEAGVRPGNCGFRLKPATDSDAIRPPIPTEVGHPFRSKPATLLRPA